LIFDIQLLFFEKFDLAAHPDPGRRHASKNFRMPIGGGVSKQAAPTSFWPLLSSIGESFGAAAEKAGQPIPFIDQSARTRDIVSDSRVKTQNR
jgi:hypothetical protein